MYTTNRFKSSLLCPICHSSSNSSFVSSNYTFWLTLSSSPPFTLPSQPLVEEEDDKKECEDCEFIKRVKDIKDDWKKGVEEISNDDVMKNYLKEFGIQSEKLSMNQVNEEIKRLEDSLNKLNHKKERIIADLNMMNEDKEKITQSTSFLFSYKVEE